MNRDHTLVFATSRGTDGEIERRSAKDDAVQHEIETLCEEPPSKRVFKKIETRVRKQETLRDQVQAAPLQLHGARVRLRIAQPRGIDTS